MDTKYKYGFFIAVFLIIGLLLKTCNDQKELKDSKIESMNLTKALTDTLHHFTTKEGDWGVEKRTMQASLKDLNDKNLNLTENQQLLMKRVAEQDKTNKTIAAALIDLTAQVQGIRNDMPVSQTDSSVQFADKKPDLEYDMTIFNVKALDYKRPSLFINNIKLPNKQDINFHWKDDKKEGYPVSFSVVNSNQYFKVNDIQSYIIPEIKKEELDPTFWQKIAKFGKTGGGKLVVFGVGAGTGALVYSLVK